MSTQQIAMTIDVGNEFSRYTEPKPYEELSKLSRALASAAPEELSSNLAAFLRPLVDFDFLDLIVFKEGTSEVLWHSVGAGHLPPPDVPMEETTYWWVHQRQQPLCIADWKRDERFPVRREALKKLGFEYRSLCRLPLRTQHHRLGMFSVATLRPHDYSAEEVRFLSEVADLVALAIANTLNLEKSRRAQSDLDVKNARLGLLLDLTNNVAGNLELDEVLRQATSGARRLMRSDLAVLALQDFASGSLQVRACDLSGDTELAEEEADALAEVFAAHVRSTGKSWTGNHANTTHRDTPADRKWTAAGLKNCCVVPLIRCQQVLGILAVGRCEALPYAPDEVDFLWHVSSQLAVAVEGTSLNAELRKLRNKACEEDIYLVNAAPSELKFAEIVGKSQALSHVLRQIEVVAPTDSGVLVQGETGTGKELIAHAIHSLSSRQGRPFVRLNCAAIPSGLLESELFGHEKGAFTGAVMRKAGRFEIADKGTLFLDEVGDIPLELQPKLLRVLQEREFERLGSTQTQRVDVRVIAATHRDLKQMVEDGEFRSDLFYRLHVFPLCIPPLRDRHEDIPMLVRHYVDKHAKRMNRHIETIPSQAMEALSSYPWPGNVRELQNFIERAVILSPGSVLRPPLAELKQAVSGASSSLRTLEEAEREHVLRALRASNWVLGGPNGAATRLGMKRTTLAYRIRKLKIPCRPE